MNLLIENQLLLFTFHLFKVVVSFSFFLTRNSCLIVYCLIEMYTVQKYFTYVVGYSSYFPSFMLGFFFSVGHVIFVFYLLMCFFSTFLGKYSTDQ